jgi:mannosyltransferase OCH1-like enzyme
MIPRKIHYCWFGPKPLPQLVINCLKTWSEKLPGYEFYLWNENNSPMLLPFIKQAYEAGKYAFVSDYVRFWALDEYGGIYFDTDMFIIKPFDGLLNNKVFFAWETAGNKNISCGVIGSIPGHSFIRRILNYYNSLQFSTSSIPDLVVPGIVRHCYDEYTLKEEVAIFPHDYFYPFPYEEKENIRNFMQYQTENTYAIHLWSVSWGTWQAKLKDRMIYYLKTLRNKITH